MPCNYSNNVINPQAHVGGLFGKSQKTKLDPSLRNIHKGHLLRRFTVQNKGNNPVHLASGLNQKHCLAFLLKPWGLHRSCPPGNLLLQGHLCTKSGKSQMEPHMKFHHVIRGYWCWSQHRVYFSSYFLCLNWRMFSKELFRFLKEEWMYFLYFPKPAVMLLRVLVCSVRMTGSTGKQNGANIMYLMLNGHLSK